MDVSYALIKKKFPNVFCLDNLREIHKKHRDEIIVSFVDFLMYTEDYYLLKYAGKLSKTAWWLFSLLKGLVRRDGFVKLSYTDIMDYYCIDGKSAISKPTFFKYIDELESFGLVKRYANKKLFSTGYQNDSNTYVVINCAEEILDICREVANGGSFRELVLGAPDKPKVEKTSKKGKQPKGRDDKETYEKVKDYYSECWSTIDDFFKFLGEKNKSGKISLSRKAKMLEALYDIDAAIDDVTYAISQTIKRGVRSEKYFLKIIKNIYEEDNSEKQEVSEIQSKYIKREPNREGMTEEKYIQERRYMLVDIGYYQYVIQDLKDIDERDMNDYERKLYKAARVLEHKSNKHSEWAGYALKRRELLLKEYGIYECQCIEKNHDRSLTWAYKKYSKNPEDMVPLSKMKEIKRKHKDLFKMYKYMYPDGRYYSGL